MNESDHVWSCVAREELENSWRSRLEEAHEVYQMTTQRYKKLLAGSNGLPTAPDSPLAFARHEQSEALHEYKRVLKIFTEITIHGLIPDGRPTANTNGVGH